MAARDTPTREQHNGEGSDEGSESLPVTLEDFQMNQTTSQEVAKPAGPIIHEPPSSASTSVPAPQRFKKGNLRLLQVGLLNCFKAEQKR